MLTTAMPPGTLPDWTDLSAFPPALAGLRNDEDDPHFWDAVLDEVLGRYEAGATAYRGKHPLLLRIGRCSRWLRPHQTRWAAAGGFAWPTGYGGGAGSRRGLPELDVAVDARWTTAGWVPLVRRPKGRPLTLRIAMPARTTRRRKAAVHTIWTPGSPAQPRRKRTEFFGFVHEEAWRCVADHVCE